MNRNNAFSQNLPNKMQLHHELLIIGAGGHSKVVADAALAAGHTIAGFVDDAVEKAPVSEMRILGPISDIARLLNFFAGAEVFIAIGDNARRKLIAQQLRTDAVKFATIIHPTAVISPYAEILPGVVIMAGVVVNAGARVGEHAILNTLCSVDHDSEIGAFAHLSPGVHIAGGVAVGEGAHLGVGVDVIPGCKVGDWSVVGAGGVVVKDISPGVLAYGVPARPVRSMVAE